MLLVFTGGSGARPTHLTIPLASGAVEIGRGALSGVDDGLMSRQHARVEYLGGDWRVEDRGSRNGTAVDGQAVSGDARGAFRVLRTAATLFLFLDDIAPYEALPLKLDHEMVVGARLGEVWRRIQKSADSPTLHITGETGSGKEIAARTYHQAGAHRNGPFIAVNCATIPEGIAERLLFGAKKGAFSGAERDAEGYLQSADGGTLFLDEIGELSAAVQAKLLRVLEMRAVMALGATKATPIDVRLCSATHRDLRSLVAEGKFREDLYYRVARPHVSIPPLRERLEEIPHLITMAVQRTAPGAVVHVSLVEACLLRHWPGNVRELIAEVSDAARQVTVQAGIERVVREEHLAPPAGLGFVSPTSLSQSTPGGGAAALPARAVIEDALRQHRGQVATAARALGLQRNQLRRWLARNKIDPRSFGDGGDEPDS